MGATAAQTKELKEKTDALVKARFDGDYHKAFDHYDLADKDGKISKAELIRLLEDAGVGNWLTRCPWADGIISALDTDQDGLISGAEFERVSGG